MSSKNNKRITLIVLIGSFLIVGFFITQWWVKNYIKDFLSDKTPSLFTVEYSDLDFSLLQGNIVLYHPSVKIKDSVVSKNHTYLQLEEIQLKGIGYWNLLFNNTVSLSNLTLTNPKINHYPYHRIVSKKDKKKQPEKGIKTITINDLNIINGDLSVMKNKTDSISVSVSSYDLKASGLKLNLQTLATVPFVYTRFYVKAKNIVLNHSDYESFKIDSINSIKNNVVIKNLQLIPKYTKQELSKHLKKERDHMQLKIPEIVINEPDINYAGNRLGITTESVEITEPNLEIYRDKLIADDLTVKPLYSKSLRKLGFNLDIRQTKIKNGYISYAELVEADKNAGKIFFKNVNAVVANICNLKDAKKTEIKIHSKFMGEAPLELNWSFDVNNQADALYVSGSIMNLPAPVLNPFFKPNLNVITEGTLQQMYFTFSGDNIKSSGTMKMKYEDFKFNILRKKTSKINKFLTAIGNIFIKDGDKNTNPQGFRYGTIEAERDPTKSFFNYLWINVKSGVISTLTGDGKKE
ncbi:hypothetical protein ABS764_08545 [Flavobacterium sp. ST-87]|uniref:DUF748 domain-containing protein n=1 Tax=Flavobacterium plantiphilum TaxID=3163297 RepID=A0ABW8XUT7_9FLAO